MSKQNNLTDFLTDVANAIRAKKGSTDLINPQNFSAEIASISGGGGLEVIEMTETTATIEPNKVYVWGMVESLDITLGASTDESDFFAFRFRCSKPTMTSVTVNGAIWAEDTELDTQGKPVLDLGSWYQCEIKGGTSALYARLAHYIPFEDSNVEAMLLSKGIGDGLGVTYKDAEKVTSISTWFKDNGVITSFDELKYFTNITTLGASTFQNCLNLEKVNLDNIVKLTGRDEAGAFYNSGIKEVSLPKLSVIENPYSCEFQKSLVERILSLGKITTIPNGNPDFGFCKNCKLLTYVNLPDTLTRIGNYAFDSCTSLVEITLPASLTSIGDYAFQNCSSLARVLNLENTKVTSIGQKAFYDCSSLTEITLPAGVTCIWFATFVRCTSLAEITLPDTLTRIETYAFYSCTSLVEITLPASLTSIGDYAFQNCSSLARVLNLENTKVTSIGQKAFYDCSSLTEITLPAGVKSIWLATFVRCTSLAEITLPDTLTNIGEYAFDSCSSLQYIRIEATTPPTLASTNAIPSTIGAIYVPDESIAAYQAATNWSSFASKIKGISEMPAE